MKKIWLGVLFFIFSLNIWSQVSYYPDTINLREISVVKNRQKTLNSHTKEQTITSEDLKRYRTADLAELLSQTTSLNIKSYGVSGAAANLSLRGALGNHTQVNWNGLPLNSLTRGDMDLSMVPSIGFDRVGIVNNAPGSLYGSGTFGGAINLDNHPKWNQEGIKGHVDYEYGSFSSHSGDMIITLGNDKIYYSGKVFGAKSQGDYPYFDYIQNKERHRTHNDFTNIGTLHNLFFKLPEFQTLEAGIWYQIKDKNLPGIVGMSLENTETQKDSTFKTYLKYQKRFTQSIIEVKGGYFDDLQRYTQKDDPESVAYSIYSEIYTKRYYGDINFRHYLNQEVSIDVGTTMALTKAKVGAYKEQEKETEIAAITGIQWRKESFVANFSVRQAWHSQYNPKPLISLGGRYHFASSWSIRGGFSQKFRAPTFNDRYWVPGGNPDINPEEGYTAELGIDLDIAFSVKHKIKSSLTEFYSSINNMIMWRPGETNWEVTNYSEVQSKGLEWETEDHLILGPIQLINSLTINYTHAQITATKDQDPKVIGHDLYYTPRLAGQFRSMVKQKRASLIFSANYIGKRYYAYEKSLPQVFLLNGSAEINGHLRDLEWVIHLRANNLMNKSYEMVRSYPMPGCTFSGGISLTF